MNYVKRNFVLLSATFGAFIIFSSWNLLQMFFGTPEYFGIITSSVSEFKSVSSWMPLIRAVAQGNLFPSASTVDLNAQALLYYPYISLWFSGAIAYFFNTKGLIIIGQVILPTLTFYLMVKIYNRYINKLWSITISFITLIAFSDWSFRAFLIDLIKGESLLNLGVLQPLEISFFPIPSFSVFIFLLIFYFSTSRVRLTLKRITVFTCLWAIHTQIHPTDGIFGLVFWFCFFPIRLYRQSNNTLDYKLFFQVMLQFFISIIMISPLIYGWSMKVDMGYPFANELGFLTANVHPKINLYYYVVYLLLPILLMIFIYLTKRIDKYEILYKFWHIYMLLLVEIILINSSAIFTKGVDIDIIQKRIALFFLHLYYYVPIIYYASMPIRKNILHGSEAKKISLSFSKGLFFIFARFNRVYLPIILFLVLLFAGTSAYRNFQHQKDFNSTFLSKTLNEFENIKKYYPENGLIISQTPATNMLAVNMLGTKYSSLWVNSLANNISGYEIIDRLVLYAFIYNWPIEKFESFMSPGILQAGDGKQFNLSLNEIEFSGIGFWLLFNRRTLSSKEQDRYEQLIFNRYTQFDIEEGLKKYNVSHIFAYNDISPSIPVKSVIKLKSGNIYQVANIN